MRVLIIDDHADTSHAISRMVEMLHHEARYALTGEEGVRLASEWLPALVLVDYRLPGIDGTEVLRRLRNDMPNTMLVLFTAQPDPDVELTAKAAGARRFFVKTNLDMHSLSELIRQASA